MMFAEAFTGELFKRAAAPTPDHPPILAIDFDETITTGYGPEGFPQPGDLREGIREKLQEYKKAGWEIVLFTCRHADSLDQALQWLKEHDIPFDAVNENAPSIREWANQTLSSKIYYDRIVDDRAETLDGFLADSVKAASEGLEVAPEGKCWKVRWAEGRAMVCFRRRAHAQKFSDSTPDKNPPVYGDVPRSKKTGRAWTVRTQPTLCKTSANSTLAEADLKRFVSALLTPEEQPAFFNRMRRRKEAAGQIGKRCTCD